MRRLAILGASGHGKVIADIAECCGWQDLVFFDDAWPCRSANGCWQINGNTESLLSTLDQFDGVIVGIGNNKIRQEKQQMLMAHGARMVSLVHPQAIISSHSTLGVGSVIMAGAVLNVDAVIGCGVVLNTACSVDHDCLLGDFVHVSPGAHLAGGVHVGQLSWIGIGASVRQSVKIGVATMVGAGAVVVNNVVDGLTVVGVPARSK
ncbi:acetyltransferase [Pseudomonas sp. 148P]|uniref:Acetyltransferase n=1 Tax=Pseudomonas ulcerans TaxID=3115852 RepID=A0ABU7HZ34_9PSED|nr:MULTISPECIES: acetyltransferase [unclassified Pseudomonas]MEE1922834.1 acetyltransferase [Pseudomonas sp. 147P]MEE1936734.1 acetyltransferase [Pseudomonas sp. 148P]